MSWRLNRKEEGQLKRDFRVKIDEMSSKFDLPKISEDLQELLISKTFTNVYYEESLYICSQGRLHPNNPKIIKIIKAFIFFAKAHSKEYELLLAHQSFEADEEYNALKEVWKKNNSLHSVAVNEIKEITGLTPTLYNCISRDDKDDIENFLHNFADQANEINFSIEEFFENDQVRLLEKYKKYPPIEKAFTLIQDIFDIADNLDDSSNLAKACIKYLIKENDVIRDSIGLLGLIDDIYAINYCHGKLKSNEVQKLVDRHDSEFPNFKVPDLVASGGALSLINFDNTIKASYTRIDDHKPLRRVMYVQDTGPLAVFTCFYKSYTDRVIKSKCDDLKRRFKPGDKLYLGKNSGIRGRKIIVELEEHQDPRFKKMKFANLKDGQQAIQKKYLRNAKLDNENSKLCSSGDLNRFKKEFDQQEEQMWTRMYLNSDIVGVPSDGPVYLLSSKQNANKYLNEKMYGREIQEWLGVKEFKRSGSSSIKSTGILFPEPNVYLISDPVVAADTIRKESGYRSPSLIVVDSEVFYKDQSFIRALRSSESDAVIYLEFYKHFYLKNLLEKENGFSSLPAKLDDLVSTNADLQSSPTARFISRTKRPKKKYEVIELDALTNFYEIYKEIFKLLKEEEYFFLKIRFVHLHDLIRKRITQPDEKDIQEIRIKLGEVIDSLKIPAKFDDRFKKMLSYLESNIESLSCSNREDFLIDFIIKNQDKNIAMIVGPSQKLEGKKLQKKVEQMIDHQKFKFTVSEYDMLEKDDNFERDLLIIPSFITRRKMPKIRNIALAKKHIYFATKYEKEELEKAERRDKQRYSAFEDSEQYEEFIQTIDEPDQILNIGARDLLKDAIGSANYSNHYQGGESLNFTNSIIFLFGGSEVYALPKNGNGYAVINEKVESKRVNLLSEDSEILITSSFSGEELVENIINEDSEKYREYKEIEKSAKYWKLILKDYKDINNLSLSSLQSSLEEIGIKREISTIKHWINDKNTIAPQNKVEVISKIFKLAGNDDADKLRKCIDSTSVLYKLSNTARDQIVNRLNELNLESEISLKIGDLDIDFQRKIIDGFYEAEIPQKNLYKIMTLDDLSKEVI